MFIYQTKNSKTKLKILIIQKNTYSKINMKIDHIKFSINRISLHEMPDPLYKKNRKHKLAVLQLLYIETVITIFLMSHPNRRGS